MALITLTTDFGMRDAYVAQMKGVIASIAPLARVIDVTHEIPPFNVFHAAHVLRSLRGWFPPETIHVVVVDPGVGTDRRILLARTGGQFFLVPDNGVITFVHRDAAIEDLVVVEDRRYFLPRISTTFHGRDIFAPVAAHLASGVKPQRFGRTTDRLELLPADLQLVTDRTCVTGRVVYVDRFGNLVTNISEKDLGPLLHRPQAVEVRINEIPIGPLRSAYAEAAPGRPLALIGSTGFLEIAVNQGSALQQFGPTENLAVSVRLFNTLERR